MISGSDAMKVIAELSALCRLSAVHPGKYLWSFEPVRLEADISASVVEMHGIKATSRMVYLCDPDPDNNNPVSWSEALRDFVGGPGDFSCLRTSVIGRPQVRSPPSIRMECRP